MLNHVISLRRCRCDGRKKISSSLKRETGNCVSVEERRRGRKTCFKRNAFCPVNSRLLNADAPISETSHSRLKENVYLTGRIENMAEKEIKIFCFTFKEENSGILLF